MRRLVARRPTGLTTTTQAVVVVVVSLVVVPVAVWHVALVVVAHVTSSATMATATAVPAHVASGYTFMAKTPRTVASGFTNFRDVVVDWGSPVSYIREERGVVVI